MHHTTYSKCILEEHEGTKQYMLYQSGWLFACCTTSPYVYRVFSPYTKFPLTNHSASHEKA